MKFRRAKRDSIRALTSEVLPYEVPLPFTTVQFYGFLKKLRFEWDDELSFSVSTLKLGKSEAAWIKLMLEKMQFEVVEVPERKRTVFKLQGKKNAFPLRSPFRYRVQRNDGRSRNLAVPHPQSMLSMARFVHDYRDSILYFTNRSTFSIRYPFRVAQLSVKPPATFTHKQDQQKITLEQFDLDYQYVSSYFAYKKFNNINRFYSSAEFRTFERKYPRLIHADISKCFDSIYTHTISWVTNGIEPSKQKTHETNATFGGQFDKLMQNLNYAETNGIVIGPEVSRIFAEIILQEVDVRIERDLRQIGLLQGLDYEIMRYVDDYFVFVEDVTKSEEILEVLMSRLSEFKLHLNDHKEAQFDTPLASNIAIAKQRIRESLIQRTLFEGELDVPTTEKSLSFSVHQALIDYKSILLDCELEHTELVNSYLYELLRRMENTLLRFESFMAALSEAKDVTALAMAKTDLIEYLRSVVDIAASVYSGAPSVSHSLKLSRLIVSALKYLRVNGFGVLQIEGYRDKAARELKAQIRAIPTAHQLNVQVAVLLDCLIYLDPELTGNELEQILGGDRFVAEKLDAFGVMTLLRACQKLSDTTSLRAAVLNQAKNLIDMGEHDRSREAERALLKLSLPTLESFSLDELSAATGIPKGTLRVLRGTKHAPSLFAWDSDEDYLDRLQLKSLQVVY